MASNLTEKVVQLHPNPGEKNIHDHASVEDAAERAFLDKSQTAVFTSASGFYFAQPQSLQSGFGRIGHSFTLPIGEGATNPPSVGARREEMSDPTHEGIDLKLQVLSAQTDAKFERVLGEMRTANAEIIGHFNTLGVQVDAAKKAAEEASSRTLTTRWHLTFMVIALFAASVAVAALLYEATGWVTSLVQGTVAAKH